MFLPSSTLLLIWSRSPRYKQCITVQGDYLGVDTGEVHECRFDEIEEKDHDFTRGRNH